MMISKKEFYTQGNTCPVRVVLYDNPDVVPKACILYFHGGGLLYGHSDDLPRTHLERLTSTGYPVASFEYPLAPAADLRMILSSVTYSINHYLCHPEQYVSHKLPYVLFGRSAGAYLCLIAAAHGVLAEKPAGILSYYGYGFLCDNWFETKSSYYASLPAVSENCLKAIPSEIHTSGDLDTHYSVYVYARQTGKWKSLIYKGREKFFYLDYSLRTCRVRCLLPIAPAIRTYRMRSFWRFAINIIHPAFSAPETPTTLTGMRLPRIQQSCWTRRWPFSKKQSTSYQKSIKRSHSTIYNP